MKTTLIPVPKSEIIQNLKPFCTEEQIDAISDSLPDELMDSMELRIADSINFHFYSRLRSYTMCIPNRTTGPSYVDVDLPHIYGGYGQGTAIGFYYNDTWITDPEHIKLFTGKPGDMILLEMLYG